MRSGDRVLDLGWTSGGGRVVPTGNTVGAQRPYHYWGCRGCHGLGSSGKEGGPLVECRFFCILVVNAGSGLGGGHEAHPCWG